MDDDDGRHKPGVRRIALGIHEHLFLFAHRHGSQTWKQFAITDPNAWQDLLRAAMDDPNTAILFNLEGVNVWLGITRAASNTGGATATD